MPKSIEAVMIHLGIQKAGGVSVILNPGFKRDEMAYFLEDTDAKIIVVGKKEEGVIRTRYAKRLILSIDTESPFYEEKLFPPSPPWTSPPVKPPRSCYPHLHLGDDRSTQGSDPHPSESDPRCPEHHPDLGDLRERHPLATPFHSSIFTVSALRSTLR